MNAIETEIYLLVVFILSYLLRPEAKLRSMSAGQSLLSYMVAPKGAVGFVSGKPAYLLLVYLVTALVPSLTACLASSPGRSRRTAVWISRDVMVDFLL